MFCKAIINLHTFSIDIRLLPTNYRHVVLAHHSIDNVPKFHVKIKMQIIFNYEICKLTFDVQHRLGDHNDSYSLLLVSFTRLPQYVKKRNFDHSHKDFLFDWPLHLNESYIFNMKELFPDYMNKN